MADEDSLKDKDFILLLRGGRNHSSMSPEEMQQVLAQFTAWIDQLKSQGQYLGGKPLEHVGRLVSGKDGQLISDGPFAEAKEVIAGFIMIRAADLDQAAVIAKGCPQLGLGGDVEVRPILKTHDLG